jgi:hypothetical protein
MCLTWGQPIFEACEGTASIPSIWSNSESAQCFTRIWSKMFLPLGIGTVLSFHCEFGSSWCLPFLWLAICILPLLQPRLPIGIGKLYLACLAFRWLCMTTGVDHPLLESFAFCSISGFYSTQEFDIANRSLVYMKILSLLREKQFLHKCDKEIHWNTRAYSRDTLVSWLVDEMSETV